MLTNLFIAPAIYGNQLAKVIHQMIVVSQVAALGREFEMKMQDPNLAAMPSRKSRKTLGHPLDWDWGGFSNSVQDEDDEPTDEGQQTSKRPQQQRRLSNTTDPQQQRRLSNMTETIKSAASPNIADKRNQGHGMLKGSERIKMMELLEAWEEPEREAGQPVRDYHCCQLKFCHRPHNYQAHLYVLRLFL